jgi:hypothetical protein
MERRQSRLQREPGELRHHRQFRQDRLPVAIALWDNDFRSIIDIYFYETFSNPNSRKLALGPQSLDTLSDVRIKVLALLF